MVQLVDFQTKMWCPSCSNALWFHVGYGDNWNYYDKCFPKYCDGNQGLFLKCKRKYPHLHWHCKTCKCNFASETQSGQQKMREIIK